MPLWQKDILVNFWWGCCIYSDCGSTFWCILVPSQEGGVRPHEYFWEFHSNLCKLCLAWEHLDGYSMGLRETKKQSIKKLISNLPVLSSRSEKPWSLIMPGFMSFQWDYDLILVSCQKWFSKAFKAGENAYML